MNDEKSCERSYRNRNQAASGGAVYGLGLIGAAIYFIAKATTFWVGVLGFLKALIWPAILVFYALRSLGA